MTAIDLDLAGKRYNAASGYFDLIDDEADFVPTHKPSDVLRIYPRLVEEPRVTVVLDEKLPTEAFRAVFKSFRKRMASVSQRQLDRALAAYIIDTKFTTILARLPSTLPPLNEEVRVLLSNIDKMAKNVETMSLLSNVHKLIADVNAHLFAAETLNLMYSEGDEEASSEAISTLFDRLSDCIEEGRTNYIDDVMQTVDLQKLSPEMMVGVLRFTSIVRDKLTSRTHYFYKVREELNRRAINSDEVLHGVSAE
jgi:hypothetical protein